MHIPLHFDTASLERFNKDESIVEKMFPSSCSCVYNYFIFEYTEMLYTVGMIMSGWEQQSEYEELPQNISTKLKSFFKPMNEALFTLIKERYEHW